MANIMIALIVNFNSIKVRLELIKYINFAATAIFQFHKGTIRTAVAGHIEVNPNAISIP